MARPSRNLAPVDYGGQDEDEVQQPARKQQKTSGDDIFSALGFVSSDKMKTQADGMAAIFAGSRGGTSESTTATTTTSKLAPIFAPSPAVSKQPKVVGKQPKAVGKQPKATGGYEMQRRALGDAVKGAISVEKWCIAARCQCTTRTTMDVFRNLIVPNAADVTPPTFDSSTPVVVAAVRGSSSAGEIFGKTKITGGTRMGSWSANKMELIFFPPTGELRCWWTML